MHVTARWPEGLDNPFQCDGIKALFQKVPCRSLRSKEALLERVPERAYKLLAWSIGRDDHFPVLLHICSAKGLWVKGEYQ